jgi:hypothetical protein
MAFIAGCLVASNVNADCGTLRSAVTTPVRVVTNVVEAQPLRTVVCGVVARRPVATAVSGARRVACGVACRVGLR